MFCCDLTCSVAVVDDGVCRLALDVQLGIQDESHVDDGALKAHFKKFGSALLGGLTDLFWTAGGAGPPLALPENTRELKELITTAGLSYDGCDTKAALQSRARDALQKLNDAAKAASAASAASTGDGGDGNAEGKGGEGAAGEGKAVDKDAEATAMKMERMKHLRVTLTPEQKGLFDAQALKWEQALSDGLTKLPKTVRRPPVELNLSYCKLEDRGAQVLGAGMNNDNTRSPIVL